MSLVQKLPPGLCERLLALPVRRDSRTGTIDIAVVDARDPHPVEEMGYWLRAPVRMVRTSLASMEGALRRIHDQPDAGLRTLAAPIWVPSAADPHDRSRTPAYGSPGMFADEADLVDPSPTEVVDLTRDPDIPIPLTRKSIVPVSIIELGEPVIERNAPTQAEPDPVLDLRRRRTSVFPASPNAPRPPFPDVTPILEAIRDSNDRDTILELLVAGARTAARKVAVLAVKREALVGWTCSPELGDRSALREVRISIPLSDILGSALQADMARLGRLPKDAAHAPLLGAMASPPGEIALASVKVDGKAVALLLADEIGDTLVVTRRMEELARVAGESLGRLLRDKRRG
jgi:hypothetical protein